MLQGLEAISKNIKLKKRFGFEPGMQKSQCLIVVFMKLEFHIMVELIKRVKKLDGRMVLGQYTAY